MKTAEELKIELDRRIQGRMGQGINFAYTPQPFEFEIGDFGLLVFHDKPGHWFINRATEDDVIELDGPVDINRLIDRVYSLLREDQERAQRLQDQADALYELHMEEAA